MYKVTYHCPHDSAEWEVKSLYVRKSPCPSCNRMVEFYEFNKIKESTKTHKFEVEIVIPESLDHMVKVDDKKIDRAIYDMFNTILKEYDTVRIRIDVNEL